MLCVIPCLMQQDLMSGSCGDLTLLTVLVIPGERVRERTVSEGKLLPCIFLDVTVTSYMVKGTRVSTVTLLVPLETYTQNIPFNRTRI